MYSSWSSSQFATGHINYLFSASYIGELDTVSKFINIILLLQLSCVSSSAELAKRHRYPNYFQLLAPDDDLADGFLAIIQKFGWTRVAIITQRENLLTAVNATLYFVNSLIYVCCTSYNIISEWVLEKG